MIDNIIQSVTEKLSSFCRVFDSKQQIYMIESVMSI